VRKPWANLLDETKRREGRLAAIAVAKAKIETCPGSAWVLFRGIFCVSIRMHAGPKSAIDYGPGFSNTHLMPVVFTVLYPLNTYVPYS